MAIVNNIISVVYRGLWTQAAAQEADFQVTLPDNTMVTRGGYRFGNEVIDSSGLYWKCIVEKANTTAPSASNAQWEQIKAPSSWAQEGNTEAIPASKLGNAGSAGAGFLFGDDAPFTFSTTEDSFSTQTFTGITVVGSSTYITFSNLVDGTDISRPDFDQLRLILLGGHSSGILAQSHTFNMTPSGMAIVVPAGTFVNTGLTTTGMQGTFDFVFADAASNPFAGNITSQTGFIHIGAQTRVHTLVADRGITGVVNGDILEINANVPDNAVTSISPEIEVTYTSSDDSLVSSAIVSMIMSSDDAASRFRDHFGRETQFGSVNVHETTTLVIDPAVGSDTNFNLVVGDEIRLTGLEGNDRITIDFTDTPGQTTDDAPQRAQDFADALGAADGTITIAANTRVIHSIANGTNTEIRRLTDENNILTSGIAVDLEINQSDGEDATNGQVATYDGNTMSWVASDASGGGLTVQSRGNTLDTEASTLNFTGNGVITGGNGANKTINILGGTATVLYVNEVMSSTGANTISFLTLVLREAFPNTIMNNQEYVVGIGDESVTRTFTTSLTARNGQFRTSLNTSGQTTVTLSLMDADGNSDPINAATGVAFSVVDTGSAGTNVEANPGGTNNTDLTSITIGNTNYDIASGDTAVEPFRTADLPTTAGDNILRVTNNTAPVLDDDGDGVADITYIFGTWTVIWNNTTSPRPDANTTYTMMVTANSVTYTRQILGSDVTVTTSSTVSNWRFSETDTVAATRVPTSTPADITSSSATSMEMFTSGSGLEYSWATGSGGADSNPGVPNFTETADGDYGLRRQGARQLRITIPDSSYLDTSGNNIQFAVGFGGTRTSNLIANSAQTLRAGIAGSSGFRSFSGVRNVTIDGDVLIIDGDAGTYEIIIAVTGTVDANQFTTNLGTVTSEIVSNRPVFTVVVTDADLDASTRWALVTANHPLWSATNAYAVGDITIDNNRLYRCIADVNAQVATTHHITSDQVEYISTPDDNGVFLLRFSFTTDQTVHMGTYRFSFIDNNGDTIAGTFEAGDIRDDDNGNPIGINMSRDKWLIQYSDIDFTTGSLPNTYISISNPEVDIQNGTLANMHPGVDTARWAELSGGEDARIPNHNRLAAYEPGDLVTDPLSTFIFRCIEEVEATVSPGNEITDFDIAHIVDDNGEVSLRIRFLSPHIPVPTGSNGATLQWTFHANIQSGPEVTATFFGNDVRSGPTGTGILGGTASNIWHIRVSSLHTIGDFPITETNVDAHDYLDVSHASLHTGGYNARPGADNEHWERIATDLPPLPTQENGRFELSISTPTTTFGPNNGSFVTAGSVITQDAVDVDRIGGGTTQMFGSFLAGPDLNAAVRYSLSNAQTGSTFTPLAANTTISAGDGLSLLLSGESGTRPGNADALLTSTGGTRGNLIMFSSRTDVNNWWLALIDTTNRQVIGTLDTDGAFYQFAFDVTVAGSTAQFIENHSYDIVFGERNLIYTDTRTTASNSDWVPVMDTGGSVDTIYETEKNNDQTVDIVTGNTGTGQINGWTDDTNNPASSVTGVTSNVTNGTWTLTEGRYLVDLTMGATLSGANNAQRGSMTVAIRDDSTDAVIAASYGANLRARDITVDEGCTLRKRIVVPTGATLTFHLFVTARMFNSTTVDAVVNEMGTRMQIQKIT